MNTHRSGMGLSVPEPHIVAAELLNGLETLRAELGSVADELIQLLRNAGVRPPGERDKPPPRLH